MSLKIQLPGTVAQQVEEDPFADFAEETSSLSEDDASWLEDTGGPEMAAGGESVGAVIDSEDFADFSDDGPTQTLSPPNISLSLSKQTAGPATVAPSITVGKIGMRGGPDFRDNLTAASQVNAESEVPTSGVPTKEGLEMGLKGSQFFGAPSTSGVDEETDEDWADDAPLGDADEPTPMQELQEIAREVRDVTAETVARARDYWERTSKIPYSENTDEMKANRLRAAAIIISDREQRYAMLRAILGDEKLPEGTPLIEILMKLPMKGGQVARVPANSELTIQDPPAQTVAPTTRPAIPTLPPSKSSTATAAPTIGGAKSPAPSRPSSSAPTVGPSKGGGAADAVNKSAGQSANSKATSSGAKSGGAASNQPPVAGGRAASSAGATQTEQRANTQGQAPNRSQQGGNVKGSGPQPPTSGSANRGNLPASGGQAASVAQQPTNLPVTPERLKLMIIKGEGGGPGVSHFWPKVKFSGGPGEDARREKMANRVADFWTRAIHTADGGGKQVLRTDINLTSTSYRVVLAAQQLASAIEAYAMAKTSETEKALEEKVGQAASAYRDAHKALPEGQLDADWAEYEQYVETFADAGFKRGMFLHDLQAQQQGQQA